MITTALIWIVLIISLVLIVTGIYFKKKALLLVLLGGSILLVCGILIFIDPVSYPTLDMQYTYDNGTLTNVTEVMQASPINSTVNYVIGWVFMLLGLASIIGASIKLYDSRYDEEDPEQIKIFD